jgi:multimeric flavodoxin WrbA
MALHLAIYGSPRDNGFSSRAHDELTLKKKSSSIISCRAYTNLIQPCTGCGACASVPICPIDDSMQEIYKAIRNADTISISTPVYFSSVPGPLKNIIDRCQLFWEEKKRGTLLKPKTGELILSTGSFYESPPPSALTVIKHLFNTINCRLDDSSIVLIKETDSLTLPA